MVTGEDGVVVPGQDMVLGQDVQSYQLGGNPAAPPALRGLHPHAAPHPGQSSTPPTPQDLKTQHLQQPQPHQMAQQQGQMPMWNPAARNNIGSQGQYYSTRPQPNQQRGVGGRPALVMSNNSSPSMMQPAQVSVQPLFAQMMPQVYMPQTHLAQQSYPVQAAHRSSYSYPQTYLVHQQTPQFYPAHFQQNVIYPQLRTNSGGPVPQAQGVPQQPPPGGSEQMGAASTATTGKKQRRANALPIINPNTMQDVTKELYENNENGTPPRSGESSSRQTPQPNSGQSNDQAIIAEFAARVAIAAGSDDSSQQPSSRTSNYSESESQPSPDPHTMSPSGMTSAKLVTAVDNIPPDNQMVENNINYDPGLMGRWLNVEYVDQPIPGMHIMHDVVMRQPPPPQPSANQPPPPASWGVMPPESIMMNPEEQQQQQQQQQQQLMRQERGTTPVVSALRDGPTVDIPPRQPVVKGQHHQSPGRKKPAAPQQQYQQQQQPAVSDVVVKQVQVEQQKQILVKNDNNNIVLIRGGGVGDDEDDVSVDENVMMTSERNVTVVVPEVSSSSSSPDSSSADAKTNKHKTKKQPQQQQPPPQQQQQQQQVQQSKSKIQQEIKKEATQVDDVNVVEPLEPEIVTEAITTTDNVVVDTNVQKELECSEDVEIVEEDKIVAAKNEENNKQTAAAVAADAAVQEQQQQQQIPDVIDSPKVVLKHNYKDDQWSPVNPAGKKKYEREFLLDLQHDPQSRRKPENLPDLDLLRDNHSRRVTDKNYPSNMGRSNDSLMPSFANKSSSLRGMIKPNRGSQQGNKTKSNKSQIIHMSLSLHEDVKLNEAENAWKPARIRNKDSMTDDEIKTEELYKKVRGVLNKLTPQKFHKLVQQVKSLPIDNCSRLQGVIDLIFEKAVDEPSYSVAYAHMCHVLSSMDVPVESGEDGEPGKTVNFKKLILARCQCEFENKPDDLNREARLKEIADEPDSEKKKDLQSVFEEDERKVRMKSVGNIRFIGELFKLEMLTKRILTSCITTLFDQGGEESLECLCKLLTTVGKNLDTVTPSQQQQQKDKKAPGKNNRDDTCLNHLNVCFDKLKEIVRTKSHKNENISARVRFMIQDVIDLRDRDWVPRRDDSNPKTMDQIQKDAERESIETSIALSSPLDRNKRQDSRNSLDRKNRGNNNEGGWTIVPPNSKIKYAVDTSKFRVPLDTDISSVSLGSRGQFTVWNQGVAGSKNGDIKTTNNMYSVLDEKTITRIGMKTSASQSSQAGYKSEVRSSSRSASQHGQSSRSSSRDSVSSKSDKSQTTAPVVAAVMAAATPPASAATTATSVVATIERKQLTEEQFVHQSKALLDEYIACTNLEETVLAMEATFDPSQYPDLVFNMVNTSLEKSRAGMEASITLIESLILKKFIRKEHFLDGLLILLESAEDLCVDVPKMWEFLAEYFADMLINEAVTLRDVFSVLEPIPPTLEFGVVKLLSKFFQLLSSKKDKNWIKMMWELAKVNFSQVLSSEKNIHELVQSCGLEYLTESSTSSESNVQSMSYTAIGEYIYQMLTMGTTCDEVFAWIDNNVKERRGEGKFIRELTTVVLRACTSHQSTSGSTLIPEDYMALLKRYIDGNEVRELACLFAVQAYDRKLEHPAGFLLKIFEQLNDHGVIPSESFLQWRDSTEPQEQEDKGVAVKSLTCFFTLIAEAEQSDDES